VPPTVVALRPKRAEIIAWAQFPEWKLARGADQSMQLNTLQDKSPNAVSADEGDRGRRAAPDAAAPGVATRWRARAT